MRITWDGVMLSDETRNLFQSGFAFNGKETYEKFAQRPCKLGLQTEKIYGARVFVLPATGTKDSDRGIRLRYFRQLAHSLDTQAALQPHPCPYLIVDAVSPELAFW